MAVRHNSPNTSPRSVCTFVVLKCEFFTHFGSCLLKLHDILTSQLEVMFPFAGTAHEAGAGGRSGAADKFPQTRSKVSEKFTFQYREYWIQ